MCTIYALTLHSPMQYLDIDFFFDTDIEIALHLLIFRIHDEIQREIVLSFFFFFQ